MDKCILDWLDRAAEQYPEKTAYASLAQSLTFREVREAARRTGSGILEMNLAPGPAAVILDKEVTTIAAFLGTACSGRAYAPVDASLPDSRIEKILSCLQPPLVITEEKYQERIRGLLEAAGVRAAVADAAELQSSEPDEALLAAAREQLTETDPLYAIFTSGSSGVPKGVITCHHSLMCYIDAYTRVMGIDENDRIGNQSPLDYIAAIRDIYLPLYTGASDWLIPKNYFMQPEKLAEFMDEKQITALGWSTSAIVLLTSFGITEGHGFDSVRKICFSGSVMPGGVLRKWQQMLPETLFVNQYGPTEATASCTYYVVDHPVEENESIPIGKPYRNYKILLLKEDGTEAGIGEEGEICVGGPILALGYYNNPEKTRQDFIQNPLNRAFDERIYKTGDIGEKKADGLLYFHGRKDRQVKMMGHRVELDEVESAAAVVPGIGECSAAYNHGQEALWLFYTGEATAKEITVGLRKQLPGFMVPRKMVRMEALPKLPNGKTDLKTLQSLTQG